MRAPSSRSTAETSRRRGSASNWNDSRIGGKSMKHLLLIGCFLALIAGTEVNAADCIKNQYGDVVCGKGQCATDQYGKVFCAKEGGGAMRDREGNVKCGVGSCATDDQGEVRCST